MKCLWVLWGLNRLWVWIRIFCDDRRACDVKKSGVCRNRCHCRCNGGGDCDNDDGYCGGGGCCDVKKGNVMKKRRRRRKMMRGNGDDGGDSDGYDCSCDVKKRRKGNDGCGVNVNGDCFFLWSLCLLYWPPLLSRLPLLWPLSVC